MYAAESSIQFAICVALEEGGNLEPSKVYRIMPDAKALKVDCLRVIDESSEDYLYPQEQFVIVEFYLQTFRQDSWLW